MRRIIKGAIMLIGAACVLLLAGGFPLMGVPEVYRGGAMLLLGLAATLLCGVGGWRLASGEPWRLLGGLLCVFFSCAGAIAVWQFGEQASNLARMGGPMWFGAVGMGCTAIVGILFAGLFGFFAKRVMHKRLWLAGVHWALVLIAIGAYTDYCSELRIPLHLHTGNKTGVDTLTTPGGKTIPLGFTLAVEDFHLSRYDTRTYSLHQFVNKRWQAVATLPETDGKLSLPSGEQIHVNSLRTAPGMPYPFLVLPGEPAQVVMQDVPPVKEYRADCRIDTLYRNRPETRRVSLRVNEPLSCKGWVIYLMNYRDTATGTELELLCRRAPGRLLALAGMVGVILCSTVWCWSKTKKQTK